MHEHDSFCGHPICDLLCCVALNPLEALDFLVVSYSPNSNVLEFLIEASERTNTAFGSAREDERGIITLEIYTQSREAFLFSFIRPHSQYNLSSATHTVRDLFKLIVCASCLSSKSLFHSLSADLICGILLLLSYFSFFVCFFNSWLSLRLLFLHTHVTRKKH